MLGLFQALHFENYLSELWQLFLYLKIIVLYRESFPNYIKFIWIFTIYHDFKPLSHTNSSGFETEEISEMESFAYSQELAKKDCILKCYKIFSLTNIETCGVVLWVNC